MEDMTSYELLAIFQGLSLRQRSTLADKIKVLIEQLGAGKLPLLIWAKVVSPTR